MADIPLEGCTVDLVRRTYTGPGRSGELTETEARLLAYLAERPSRDVSRDELLVEVWGMPVTSLSRCVDTAMRRLRVKLERVPRRPRHFVTRHGTGYRFEPLRQAAAAVRAASVAPTLLGRARELTEVVETLHAGVRWITLHGPAGIGKTALARALVVLEASESPEPVYFASLTAADSKRAVVTTLAELADVKLATAEPRALADALSERPTGLWVLDTAEHVVEAVRSIASALLAACPEARVLVTSRVRIDHPDEHLIGVGPLDEEAATTLLRTRAANHGAFHLDEDEARGLVVQLDGVPLAIELAAARTSLLTLSQIRERLAVSASHRWLGARGSVADDRHRTLEDALDWSWALLDDAQREALGQLVVLPTSFPVDAVEFVLDVSGEEPLDLLDALSDASWVVREQDATEGDARFRMLDAVRAFVSWRIPEPVAARRRLRGWAAALCDDWAEVRLGPPGVQGRAVLATELDHLLAAHADAVEEGDADAAIRIAIGLDRHFRQRGPADVLLGILEASAELRSRAEPPLHSAIARQYGDLLRTLGREGALPFLEEAVEVATACGDGPALARAQQALAVGLDPSEIRRTVELLRASLSLCETLGLDDWAAMAWLNLAPLLHGLGDHDSAVDAARRARTILDEAGDSANVANADALLGALLAQRGDLGEGLPRLRDAAAVFRRAGQARDELTTCLQLGAAALDAHLRAPTTSAALDEADEAWQRAATLARALGVERLGIQARVSLGVVAFHRGDLEDADARLAKGQLDSSDLGEPDVMLLAWRAATLVAWGRRGEADAVAELARAQAERSGHPVAVVLAALARAFVTPDARADALAQAQPFLDRAIAVRLVARTLRRTPHQLD